MRNKEETFKKEKMTLKLLPILAYGLKIIIDIFKIKIDDNEKI